MIELTTVSDDDVVIFVDGQPRRYEGLEPGTSYRFDGVDVRTLPRRGELLCRFATVNDVHFGETECGRIDGIDVGRVFRVGPDDEPYPDLMNRGAIAEIAAIDPEVVLVKGDLTSNGRLDEYERFRSFYCPAFGDRLRYVRGNHDSYHGATFGARPVQEIVLEGVTLAVLDTAREHQVNGSISTEQLEWLDELAARADRPVLVFGHHNMWNPGVDPRSDSFFGVRPDDAEALFAVFVRRSSLRGYFAGHTHRNHRFETPSAGGPVPFVEVACVKDYPGSWAEYRVFDGVILQVHRRVSDPDALRWTEATRDMFDGAYGIYAFGRLDDRCFVIEPS